MLTGIGVTENELSSLRTFLEGESDVKRVWVIGSRAKQTARPDSDIDLVLEPLPDPNPRHWRDGHDPLFDDEYLAAVTRWWGEDNEHQARLQAILKPCLHLHFIDYPHNDTLYREAVEREGILVYERG